MRVMALAKKLRSLLNITELSIPRPNPTSTGTIYTVHPILTSAIKQALANPDVYHIVFLDELGRSEDSRCGNEQMQMIQNRVLGGVSDIKINKLTDVGTEFLESGGNKKDLKLGVHYNVIGTKDNKLPDNIRFVGAMNPSNELEGFENSNFQVNGFDPAQLSRGVCIIMEADLKSWTDWATDINKETGKPNIHPMVVEFVNTNTNLFNQPEIDDTIKPNPRAWTNASKAYNAYTKDENNFVLQMLTAGVVGRAAMTTFISFVANAKDPLIKPQDIFNKKLKKLPESIVERMSGESFARKLMTTKNMIQYMQNLADEKAWGKVNADIHLLVEIITSLPDDMEVSTMLKMEESHKALHERCWKREEYKNSYLDKLSRF